MAQTGKPRRFLTLPPPAVLVALLGLVSVSVSITMGMPRSASASPFDSEWEDRIKFGVRAYDTGDQSRAFDIFSKLASQGASDYGISDGRMARIYVNLGAIYDEQKQLDLAERSIKRGLNIAQKGYGAKSLAAVPGLINLAQAYYHMGRDVEAEPIFKQALAIVDKPGDESLLPYVVVIEANLGGMYFAEGNYGPAEPRLRRALQVATQCLGPGHKWTTTIAGMCAASLRAAGKEKEAKSVQQAAIAKANESTSPIMAWTKQIGVFDEKLAAKDYVQAESALKLALKAAQELQSEPMLQGLVLERYGRFYLAQDRTAQAIEKLKAAQALAESVLGPEDAQVLVRTKQLADLEKSKEQYPDAEPLYRRLVTNAQQTSGPESVEYENAVADLADLYKRWAQYGKAVTYYGKQLAVAEKRLGADSEKLIPVLVALATAEQNNPKQFAEVDKSAEGHFKRAADIATKHYGKNSNELTSILKALSEYYQRHFDWDQASKVCVQIIAAAEKNYGPKSPETVAALQHYALVLRAAALRHEAEQVEERILKIQGPVKRAEDE